MASTKRRDRIAASMMVAIYKGFEPGFLAKEEIRADPTGFRKGMARDAVAYADALIEALDAQTVGRVSLSGDSKSKS